MVGFRAIIDEALSILFLNNGCLINFRKKRRHGCMGLDLQVRVHGLAFVGQALGQAYQAHNT